MTYQKESVVLLIHCKDRRGIVARVSGFIHDFGGNILDSDHHTDEETSEFLMRMEFPRWLPEIGIKNREQLSDEMPDYDYDLSLQDNQLIVKGKITDEKVRKISSS